MFWRRNGDETPSQSAESHDAPAGTLDILGTVLRAVATFTIDPEDEGRDQLDELFEAWVQHVLLDHDVPGREEQDLEGGERDWAGLRHFVTDHLRRSSGLVRRSRSELRDVILACAEQLSRFLVEDARFRDETLAELDKLRLLIKNSHDTHFRLETLGSINAMGRIIDERQTLQKGMSADLGRRIRALSTELDEIRRDARSDSLTELLNRKTFDLHLLRAQEYTTLVGDSSCLLFIDLDHFKMINDSYGHLTGDAVLKEVGRRLAATFPRPCDTVARYGGEEFAVILRETSLEDGRRYAERLRTEIRSNAIEYRDLSIPLSISVGISNSIPYQVSEEWIERADKAVYRAKGEGRDQVQVFDPNADDWLAA